MIVFLARERGRQHKAQGAAHLRETLGRLAKTRQAREGGRQRVATNLSMSVAHFVGLVIQSDFPGVPPQALCCRPHSRAELVAHPHGSFPKSNAAVPRRRSGLSANNIS